MEIRSSCARIALLCTLPLLFQFLSCASPVPGGTGLGALSGKSLLVTMTFAGPVNPQYYYYFTINNSQPNSASAPGAVPVGSPISGTPYLGNGFATGSDVVSGGFTDFVLFSNNQNYPSAQPANGFALYHVKDGTNANNPQNFIGNGVPIQYQSPILTNGNSISFQIDLAQLFTYPGSTYTQSAAVSKALAPGWLQVNVIATNVVPYDTQTTVNKLYDSFGDDSNGVGSFLNLDLTQTTYVSGLTQQLTEPTGDVFMSPQNTTTSAFPALDLVSWSIQIVTN
jgi:hypothetical protein